MATGVPGVSPGGTRPGVPPGAIVLWDDVVSGAAWPDLVWGDEAKYIRRWKAYAYTRRVGGLCAGVFEYHYATVTHRDAHRDGRFHVVTVSKDGKEDVEAPFTFRTMCGARNFVEHMWTQRRARWWARWRRFHTGFCRAAPHLGMKHPEHGA